jgi:voltage-gated potassium channel
VDREELLRRIERFTDLPLLILALALVPLLIVPAVVTVRPPWDDAILVADWAIWAVFAADFGVKLAVAPRRVEFLRRHWLEGLMVLLPFLRPLRVLRVLRLARVAVALGFNVQVIRDILAQRGTKVIVAAVVGTLVVGATLAYLAERGEPGATITSYGDAIWWAAVTMTTVGYGDVYPTTPMGRGLAVALMLFGIAALSALTATVAAFLVRESREETTLADLLAELRALREEVARLRAGE